MRAFNVTIQFADRAERVSIISRSSMDALLRAFDLVKEGEPFGVTVQEHPRTPALSAAEESRAILFARQQEARLKIAREVRPGRHP